jgi:predicted dehydrogenase
MGPLHAEKLVQLEAEDAGVQLVGVADINPRKARRAAERFAVPGFEHVREMLPYLDALIVAVPTTEHITVVRDALEAGVDVLVEKPITADLEEAQELLLLAEARGRLIQVGHLEWFNAAMDVIREHFREPHFIEAYRVGPFTARSTDIDVVRDLMIHDLDIIQQLIGEEPESIEAVGLSILTPSADVANARLVYPGGCVASLTASRVSPNPMRKIRFFQPDGYFSADFLNQTGVVASRDGVTMKTDEPLHFDKIEVNRSDALLAQLRAFIDTLRTRKRPAVDAMNGLGALRTAIRVNEAISMNSAGPGFDPLG